MYSVSTPPGLVSVRDNVSEASGLSVPVLNDNITATIYYPSEGTTAGGDGLLQDQVRIAFNVLAVRLAEELMAEYLRRLPTALRDTRLMAVYRDRDNILYVDLSDDFRKGFSGDARQEYNLLNSLYKTLTSAIPGITDVKLLLEGREVETLGGHFMILNPLGSLLSSQRPSPPVQTPGLQP